MLECFDTLIHLWGDPERIKQRQRQARQQYREAHKAQQGKTLTPQEQKARDQERARRLQQAQQRRANKAQVQHQKTTTHNP
ncbi:hypothetical protein [Thiofilum flexile]|uniref:hypothetical protein n=1 Tax=Thiofilum flexile TaxID=125627 RepID=UPI00035DE87A|nr:hypothetical protein [Thiofilum flexile]